MDVSRLIADLDGYVDQTRNTGLSPMQLLNLQTQITGIRYTLSTAMVECERHMLSAKDARDLALVRGKLKLQAQDKKMSGARAEDLVNDGMDMELLHQRVISTRIDYSAIKNRLDHSGDVLISIAQRVKRLEQEAIESRMQQQR